MKINEKSDHGGNDHTSGLGDGSSHCKASREEPGNRSRDGITWLGVLRLDVRIFKIFRISIIYF